MGDGPAVLIADTRFPTPNHDSASLRMLNLLTLLREVADPVVFAADDSGIHRSSRSRLQAAGIRVVEDASIGDHLRREGRNYRAVFLSRLAMVGKYLPLVRALAPGARVVFDTTDLVSLRGFRAAKLTGNRSLLRQAVAAKHEERVAAQAADCTLVVSPVEKALLEAECPTARVHVLSIIQETYACRPSYSEREGAVFMGAFPHHPNADAMEFFFRELYPLLKERLPSLRTLIVGTEPPDWLRRRASDDIIVAGYVPDIASVLDRCRVSIAPLRFGAGVKGKVLLSMSYGVPVVGSAIAAEGLRARDGEEMMVADDPHEFTAKVARVYEDADVWNRLSTSGRRLVERDFSFEAGRRSLRQLFGLLGVAPVSRGSR